jgi:uncharacterized protein YeaO (DUF488 family)
MDLSPSAIRTKRVYDPPHPEDGFRVLVDRLWPRGLTKQDAAIDLWLKEIAPSAELRHRYHHQPELWDEFRLRYREELRQRPDLVEMLRQRAREQPVTLLYAARDVLRNNAVALAEALAEE